jgi:hypothetical protein
MAISTINSAGTTGVITQGTAQNSTSGTSIDFTGIPSWVKRITVMFNGVSTNSTSNYLIQLGSGSVSSTGYSSGGMVGAGAGIATTFSTAGFLIRSDSASANISGSVILTSIASNTWAANGVLVSPANSYTLTTAGASPTLGGSLDRVRVTTVSGTDTFDAGSINILYE